MTYDEIRRLYLSSGGSLPMSYADPEMSAQQMMMAQQGALIQLPDGRFVRMMPDGSIVAADRSEDGDTQNMSLWSPGAQEAANQSIPYDDNNWQRSLAGALAVGVGGPLLGMAGNALFAAPSAAAGTAGTAAGTAGAGAAGATGAGEALTVDGILGSNYALTGGTALSGLGAGAMLGAPSTLSGAMDMLRASGAGLSGLSGLSSLLPLAGAAAGALGSGDRTVTTQTLMDPSARAYLDSFRARAEQVASQPYVAPDFALTQGPTAQQTAGSSALQSLLNDPRNAQYSGIVGDFISGARDGAASGNAEMGAVRGMVGAGTAAGTSAGNAEMGQVRNLVGEGTSAADAARNIYFGQNPFLNPMIDAAQDDLNRGYARAVAPKFSSGSSFGNSGLGFLELDSRNDLMRNLGRIGSEMRFGDYNLQAGLGEQFASRQDAMANANRARALQGAGLLGNLGESAAGRADTMFRDNAARSLQGAGLLGNLGESAAARTDAMFNNNANRALQATQLGQQGLRDQAAMAGNLFNQGTTTWNQGQQNIQNQYGEFLRGQNWSRDQLSAMNPGLGVGMNAGQSQTVPGDRWSGALGGGLAGLQLARYFGG